jgi:hypothetical protein
MSELDKLIHQPVRLRVMASLVTLDPKDQVDFTLRSAQTAHLYCGDAKRARRI